MWTRSARWKRTAIPRGFAVGLLSGIIGTPVELENRTVTFVDGRVKCGARDNARRIRRRRELTCQQHTLGMRRPETRMQSEHRVELLHQISRQRNYFLVTWEWHSLIVSTNASVMALHLSTLILRTTLNELRH